MKSGLAGTELHILDNLVPGRSDGYRIKSSNMQLRHEVEALLVLAFSRGLLHSNGSREECTYIHLYEQV